MALQWRVMMSMMMVLLFLDRVGAQGKKQDDFLSGQNSGQDRTYVEVRQGIPHLMHNQDGRLDLHRTPDETKIMALLIEMEQVDDWLGRMDNDPDLSPPDPNFYRSLHLPKGPQVPDDADPREFRQAFNAAKGMARQTLAEIQASMFDIDMNSNEESTDKNENWGDDLNGDLNGNLNGDLNGDLNGGLNGDLNGDWNNDWNNDWNDDIIRRGVAEHFERRQSDQNSSNDDRGIQSVIFDDKPPNPDLLDEGTPNTDNANMMGSMAKDKWAISVNNAKQDDDDQTKDKTTGQSKKTEELLALLGRLETSRRWQRRGQPDQTSSQNEQEIKSDESKYIKDRMEQDRLDEAGGKTSRDQAASKNFPDVGDFLSSEEEQAFQRSAPQSFQPEQLSHRKRIIENDINKRWPKAIVPYIFKSITDAKAINQIKVAMNKIEMYTCVRFVPWQKDVTNRQYGLGHEGHLNFIAGSGCWAVQGLSRDLNGQDISCCGWQTCVHELGHAMGAGHEHVSIDRDDAVKVNWENIQANMKMWYNKAYKGEYLPNTLDLTNIMSYSDTTFNIDGRPTMTSLEKYGKFGQNTHYYFKEMVEAHDCKGLKCPNFNMKCENDGFVTYMNSVCQCMCPPGLDPATGCTSVVKNYVSPKTEWPSGRYSMLMPESGCPATGQFMTGSYRQFSEAGNTRSTPSHLGGISRSEMTHQFCSRWSGASDSPTLAKWTPGRYCIYRLGGSCPDGFNTAYAQFDDVMPPGTGSNVKTGTIPDGVYGANSRFEFCCREDGFDDMPLMLPTAKPFILFRTDYWAKCQEVPGLLGNQEYYVYDSADVEGLKPGFYGEPAKPQGMTWSNHVYFVYYCHYDKIFSNCGGYYQLSNVNRQVTFSSPNYPSNYPASARCSWFIKGPENSKLFLTFSGFNIDPECKDALYISFENPGEVPMKFCGGDGKLQGSLHSVRNTLMLTLETMVQTAGFRGFQATVKMVPEEELCYKFNDHGASYRGQKAYTRDFKRCLPWRDVAHCPFSTFTSIDNDHGLDENYCRNPGSGRRPWCYVTAETCERGYCDACNLDELRNTLDDCDDQKGRGRCREPDVALGCAASCSGNLPTTPRSPPVRDVTCPRPPSVPDASQSSFGSKVGDTVTYKCNSGYGTVTSTCLSNAQWSAVGYVCGGCSSGWTYSEGKCYRYFPESLNTIDARKICAQENNAIISPARTPTEIKLLDKLRVENVKILVGLSDEAQEGVYVWSDGSKATTLVWQEGEPNNYYNEDCGSFDGERKFADAHCTAHKHPFICRTSPSSRKTCVNRLPICSKLYGQRPSMCSDFPSFAALMCPSTCGVCLGSNSPRALDDANQDYGDVEMDTRSGEAGMTGSQAVQCKVPPLRKGAKARRVKGRGRLRQGQATIYKCYMAYTLKAGNLVRGCQANGTLTGDPPQCTKLSRAVTKLNTVELFARRSFGEPGHAYTGPALNLLIRRPGQVTQWRFFGSDSRQVALQIWRPHPEMYGYGFQIVGQTVLTSRPDQINVVDLAPNQRIPVQPGDTVGVWYGPGHGGVTFDLCEQTTKPQGAPVFMLEAAARNLTGSGIYFFEGTANCLIFSLTATIGPLSK